MKVFLDAGHGGNDPGAVSGGLVEKNMTLICANGAKNLLEKYGIDRAEFFARMDKMAEDALVSGSPANTRKAVTKADILDIYTKLWD